LSSFFEFERAKPMATIDADILNYLVRMVVPMRREFDFKLEVGKFTHDTVYANQALQLALTSVDPRLLEYAALIKKRLRGDVVVSPIVLNAPSTPGTAASPAKQEPSVFADKRGPPTTAEELKAKMLRKYTSGLR
jgi:hypothetical protein